MGHGVGDAAAGRVFYRLVRPAEARERDFLSGAALGQLPATDDPEHVRMHRGISVTSTEMQSRTKDRRYPKLGRFIAVIDIPPEADITFPRTAQTRGHYTLWGDPAAILRCVVRVIPVEPNRPGMPVE